VPMQCDTDLLSQFVDGEVQGAQAREVSHHLKTCASCRREISDMHRVNHVLSSWGSVRRPVPAHTERRVRAAVERRRRLGPIFRLTRFTPPAVGSSIAALLLLLAINVGPMYQTASPAQPAATHVAPVIKRQAAPLQLARRRAAVVTTQPDSLQRLLVHRHFEALIN
jgi:predicted anti-sigma-YlaC factor YlaD